MLVIRAVEHILHRLQAASPDWEMRFQVGVPKTPIAGRELLPLAQNLSNAIVDATVREIETRGGKISCCKGCGACCRQLVPISEVEARYIAELVESLPEPRQSKVKARFEDAAKRLAEAGLSHSGPDLLGELMRHLTGKEPPQSEQMPK
jgi:hypothetical protein